MNYRKIIDELVSGFDLSSDVERKRAYNRCHEYAGENLSDSGTCNVFLAEAAEMLGQMKIHMDIIESKAAPSGAEKIHLLYNSTYGCELTGNRSGLLYLSRVMRLLSETPMAGEHIHLREDDPCLEDGSQNLTIYYEPEDWFDEYAVKDYEDDPSYSPPERKVAPGAIVVLCSTVEFPPSIYMSRDKVYRVAGCEEYEGQEKMACKRIREGIERMFTFSLIDDRGEEIQIGFDLDDYDIVFFTLGDLEQLIQ